MTLYAPNMNLVHDPRWGRANEVFSECPLLSGDLTAAYVQGLQNSTQETIAAGQPLLTAACCKHMFVYNIETIPHTRTYFDAVVTTRDAWETYLPVFEACIERGAGQSVMCSYNGECVCSCGWLDFLVGAANLRKNGLLFSPWRVLPLSPPT